MLRTPHRRRFPAMPGGLLALICLLALASCDRLPDFQATFAPLNIPTLTPTAAETFTPTPFDGECAFVWSNRSLPAVSVLINTALQEAGYPEVEAEASAYGENCLDPNTNSVVQFTAMQTDVYVQVQVSDITDGQAMGNWVERIMRVINNLPDGTLPGPNPGYLGITYAGGQNSASLWFPRSKADGLLNEGVRGSALYQALRGY